MSYQALYRKYRPKTFNDVYGQEIIVKTLKNVIKKNKLTHAYLFIGPRGTGKTSVAKIFAKTINCLNNTSGVSCENCDVCNASNHNENIDIIEMDAASNNGVDEIRNIKNHVTLLPSISKYKVYIIDEVHMLTIGAFNALLKTLEEPPAHVIFILATTEPHKVPLTIISRCQCFEFKPISTLKIVENLKQICKKENINYEEESLKMIADYSNGGMRDAIGLLDQLNVYCDSEITCDDVTKLSNHITKKEICDLFKYIKNNDVSNTFAIIDEIENSGKNFIYVCQDIINCFKNSLLQYKLNMQEDLVDLLGENNMMNFIMIFNNSMNQMQNNIDKRIFFDLSIIKILNIYNSTQTNVCNKYEEKSNIIKEKITEKSNSEKISKNNDDTFKIYDELMKIRLNNIIPMTNKESLQKIKKVIPMLDKNITNLDELKICNLLSDINICAASKNGIIMTTDNKNILEELYENLFEIEEIISSQINEKIFICFLLNEYWLSMRQTYIQKIKNKEHFDVISEELQIKEIQNIIKNKSHNTNVFDDLIEIGE